MQRRYDEYATASTSSAYERRPTGQRPTTKNRSEKEQGVIRLYSADGERSTVATLTKDTVAREITDNYRVDGLYMQTGNLHIRLLPPDSRPLFLLRDQLRLIGVEEKEFAAVGCQEELRSIVAFYLGRPTLQRNSGIRSEILLEECDVRRGRVVHRWTRNKVILFNGSIRIQKESHEDELLPLSGARVDLHETRRGRALRVADSNQSTLFLFKDQETLLLWLTRCQQSIQSSSYDLSDRRLTLLPESLFNTESHHSIRQLNLRRNSLTVRTLEMEGAPLLGWLDDLTRLRSMTSLDLSSNRLSVFPQPLTEMLQLTKLNLSSNQIPAIPSSIKLMKKLTDLDVSNNWLTTLPSQMVECSLLTHLNLSFNRLKHVPSVLTKMDMVRQWLLAGNQIERIDTSSMCLENLTKLDLHRNFLESSFRLPVGSYDFMESIDLRDNHRVSTVHLTNVSALKVIYCSRLQLSVLHLNGQSITHIYADHNLLDSLVIMPMPSNLVEMDISHNQFECLPDWTADLTHLTILRANHNQLYSLPPRLFSLASLRLLDVHSNHLSLIPDIYDETSIDTVLLHHNEIEQLPETMFQLSKRLRHLNVSFNKLRHLPSLHSNMDLNRIQCLRLSSNQLDESSVPIIVGMKRLKVLDLSNNKLRYFDDSALHSLTLLEDLNLSSNRLTSLAPSIPLLPSLTCLRAHSNRLAAMPDLSQSLTLQVVDMSNNDLHHFIDSFSTAPSLRSIDVSCNPSLNFTTTTMRRRQQPVSVVDIGGEVSQLVAGFSETTGHKSRMCIRRLRHGSTFVMTDGGANYELPKSIVSKMDGILKAVDNIELKTLLLRTHLQLGEQGERIGASAIVARISEGTLDVAASGTIGIGLVSCNGQMTRLPLHSELEDGDYESIRTAGHVVDENNLINGLTSSPRQLGQFHLLPAVTPDPVTEKRSLVDIDWLIMASRALWDHIGCSQLATVLQSTNNPQVAAKKMQDTLQACDYYGNSSIVVIRIPKPQHTFDNSNVQRYAEADKPSTSTVNNVPDSVALEQIENRLERIGVAISRMEDESNNNENEEEEAEDEGFMSGRYLYDRILAEELAVRSPSSSSAPPPDPQSRERSMTSNAISVDTTDPLPPRLPSTESPSFMGGRYDVLENARRYNMVISPFSEQRRLGVISEDSAELVMDETHSFSHHSKEDIHGMSSPPPVPSSPPESLTPMEEALSTRYRFEYARRNDDKLD